MWSINTVSWFVPLFLSIAIVQSEVQAPFSNLFRGSENRKNNNEDFASIVVEPLDVAVGNNLREGVIKLAPDIWGRGELDLQLHVFDEKTDTSGIRFRQSPQDQPTPNRFYGKLDVNGDGQLDSITLVNTTGLTSRIPVVTGTILVKGQLYQIRQLPNGQILVENRGPVDSFDEEIEINDEMVEKWASKPSKFSPTKQIKSPNKRRILQATKNPSNATNVEDGSRENSRQLQQDDGSVLDVLVVYSRNAMCAAAKYFNNKCPPTDTNKATIEGIINLAIEETNEAFLTSGIGTKLRLVHVHYDDEYDDAAYDWPTVFSHYAGEEDGYMDYIHNMRDQYGADFVSFFVNTRGYCGSAHRPSEPQPERAFSMVRWDCATGQYTFTHEISHNFGCRHDEKDSNTVVSPGDYNFGYQYLPPDQEARWRTVMAYDCPGGGCRRLLQYSNPSMTRQGVPLGNRYADNARFIRERLSIYANFRQTVVAQDALEAQATAPISRNIVTIVYPRGTKELETTSSPGTLIGAAGNMFDCMAKRDLKVTGFAVMAFAATTVTVEVYKMKTTGSFVGQEYNPGVWTLIGGATIETKANLLTSLPPGSFSGVKIKENDVQAFYVTFQAGTNYNRYSSASHVGDVWAQNDDIEFRVGRTVNYPFKYHPSAPQAFNGKIYYELLPTPAPTPPPIIRAGRTNMQLIDLSLSSNTDSFLTTFNANNGHSGNLFTIEAKVDMIIETFDVHAATTDADMELKVFTKAGDFSQFENDPEVSWTQIANTTIQGQGISVPTHVPGSAVETVSVKANTKQSFYITFTGPYIKYTSGLIDSNVLQNDHMSFVAGAGTQYPFRSYFPNRIWNGVVYYRLGDDGSADVVGSEAVVKTPLGPLNSEEKGHSMISASVAPRPSPPS